MRKLNCLRCEHKWYPRTPKKPKLCPKCKSQYWNKERIKRNKLTQKEVRKLFSYNKNTGILRWKIKPKNSSKNIGDDASCYFGENEYAKVYFNGEQYFTHVLIWLGVYGYIPEGDIDHKDRIKHHNWLSNLRETSRVCNVRNGKVRSDNTSGVKGVSFDKRTKSWKVYITINQKTKGLGRIKEFDEAVCTRLAAEQCVGWNGCDLNSSAFQYVKQNIQKDGLRNGKESYQNVPEL